MSGDHLSTEVSVSAELTPTGVTAGAKSRLIAAVDRLLGGAVDLLSPKLEGIAQRQRARNATDIDLIEALGARRVEMVNSDPEIAKCAIEQHLGKIGRQQDNKTAVITLALEDLREQPPTEEQCESGPPELDPDFVNRYERYAEDATSDHLRDRWGRVLAAEVRAPGTFSPKVLRTVDELDAETAQIFETFVRHRLGDVVPVGVTGELPFHHRARLVTAGLMLDPGLGHSRLSTVVADGNGAEISFFTFDSRALGISRPVAIKNPENKFIDFSDKPGNPTIPVYVLTDTGTRIASILSNDLDVAMRSLQLGIRGELVDGFVRQYIRTGDNYTPVGELTVRVGQ